MNDKLQKIKEDLVKNGIAAEQIRFLADMIEELRKDAPVIPKEGAWCAFSNDFENPLDDKDLFIRRFSKYKPQNNFPYVDNSKYPWRYCIEVEPPRAKWHWPKPDDSTPTDTPVWVRNVDYQKWELRYLSDKKGRCWFDGKTSKETSSNLHWYQIFLADPSDLDRRPPMDLEV